MGPLVSKLGACSAADKMNFNIKSMYIKSMYIKSMYIKSMYKL
jgi:hypothetical protein